MYFLGVGAARISVHFDETVVEYLDGIRITSNPNRFNQLILLYPEYISDILPESWVVQYSKTYNNANSYDIFFFPQPDIDEFLNTYWKYEGGK